jgi:hypothetical protein
MQQAAGFGSQLRGLRTSSARRCSQRSALQVTCSANEPSKVVEYQEQLSRRSLVALLGLTWAGLAAGPAEAAKPKAPVLSSYEEMINVRGIDEQKLLDSYEAVKRAGTPKAKPSASFATTSAAAGAAGVPGSAGKRTCVQMLWQLQISCSSCY